ncbi:hypothetical protein HH219_03395 [Pseudoalteromonas sp. NEC-BIFX-2020_015]|uniref:winged helix-turn-helix domain-containing protein n=1 Tax=Pseudoalteromonas sp. NEC-BIFX-2020_015 TaxID=2729544 RepID=UPI0014613BED|nr:winged helix-turn-helix domain-containing protein [Pseudoalteromonas sp. NEC-BIFX-2020_015]NMR24600.1 hypothetical protein [Pseudoalteromonas sp. NEC-BIFX-2020_015]
MGLARFLTQGNLILVGEWQLNVDQQSISDGDNVRELEPLLFKLLCYFIEHNDRIIPRQELAENIWQQSHVDDNAINRAISELRKALKSAKQPGQSIKTHYRAGYSLFIPVNSSAISAEAELAVTKPIITPLVPPTLQPTRTPIKVYWPWTMVLLLLVICFSWFYQEQPSASNETQNSMPFLTLEAETISWHKGSYYNLLLPPDKSKLAYTVTATKPSETNNIYVMDLGSKKEYLIDAGKVYMQGWSSDGERLFYIKCKKNNKYQCQQWQASNFISKEIKKMPLPYSITGGEELTQYTEIGDTAIFRRNNYRGLTHLNALYAYDKKTGEELRITTPNITGTGDYLLTSLSNPDRIIFERHNVSQSEIYMANLDGSSLKLLTTNTHRAWAATYDKDDNTLIWYSRFNSTIESFSLDTMQLEQVIEAPVNAANYAYPLDKKTILISTDLHDLDVNIFDFKTATMEHIATANKHERDGVALKNGDIYFADAYHYDKREHWLKTNNQFINITDQLGTDNIIIAADANSSHLLSYNKSSYQLSILNATDYHVIKQWSVPGHIQSAVMRNNKVAIIYTDATNQNNQIILLNTDNENTVMSDIDTPLALAWIDDDQLIVHTKNTQFLILDSQTNTYKEFATPDKLTTIKPSIVAIASNDKTLFVATDLEIYSTTLDTMQDIKSLVKMKPTNYITKLNAQNDKLAISFLSTNNPNSIELYTEHKPND